MTPPAFSIPDILPVIVLLVMLFAGVVSGFGPKTSPRSVCARKLTSSTSALSSSPQSRDSLRHSDSGCSEMNVPAPEDASNDRDEEMMTQFRRMTSNGGTRALKYRLSPWTGRIVARILPKSFVEYDVRKPPCAFDPADLLSSMKKKKRDDGWTQTHSRVEKGVTDGVDTSGSCCTDVLNLGDFDLENEEELLVTLDLDLVRQDILLSARENGIGPSEGVAGFLSGKTNTFDGAKSHTTGQTTTVEEVSEGLQENLSVHVHMNRAASEMAPRTLRRLEISTAKKVGTELPLSSYGKRPRKKQPKNVALRESVSTSAVLINSKNPDATVKVNSAIDGDDAEEETNSSASEDGYSREWDVSTITSATLWKKIASEYDCDPRTRGSARIALSLPGEENMRINIDVLSCPPTILEVHNFENFDARCYVGVPIVVDATLIFASHAVVTWFVDGVEVLTDSKCYTPTDSDIGKEISVLIVPVRRGHSGEGYEEAYKFQHKVEKLPFMPIVSPIRDDWRVRSEDSRKDLRVLTYNILADLYTSRDIDKQLMYSHCNLQHLMRWRRMPMLIAEILAYDADVICLQEVDASIYDTLLKPVLEEKGYQGFYSNKVSSQREGCAMFWSLRCFESVSEEDMHTYSIRDLFSEVDNKNDDIREEVTKSSTAKAPSQRSFVRWDSMHGITELMDNHVELRRVTREKVGQILQVAVLALKQGSSRLGCRPEKIVLANTHLFYHPMADHIRAMQAYVVCKQLDTVRRGNSPYPYPIVFCGDLNSDPLSGAVQLLFTRRLLPEHHDTWKHLNEYVWEMGDNEYMIEHGYVGMETEALTEGKDPLYLEEAFDDAHQDERSLTEESEGSSVHPPPIILPSSFPNLFSGCKDMPEFTNYAVDFVETLDYVLASEPSKREPFGFGPKQSAPMPSEEEVKRYVAMPNEFMPSDHVSVVCDLEWKVRSDE